MTCAAAVRTLALMECRALIRQHGFEAREVFPPAPGAEAAVAPAWALYEVRKVAWLNENPDASPEDSEAAMRAIAREVGI